MDQLLHRIPNLHAPSTPTTPAGPHGTSLLEKPRTPHMLSALVTHPGADWSRSSLPEKLCWSLDHKRWSSAQRAHLSRMMDRARLLREAAVAFTHDHTAGRSLSVYGEEGSDELGTAATFKTRYDELLLEKAVLQRSMIRSDLRLPPTLPCATLASLLKEHRIPPAYVMRITGEATPGGGVGFVRLLEDLLEACGGEGGEEDIHARYPQVIAQEDDDASHNALPSPIRGRIGYDEDDRLLLSDTEVRSLTALAIIDAPPQFHSRRRQGDAIQLFPSSPTAAGGKTGGGDVDMYYYGNNVGSPTATLGGGPSSPVRRDGVQTPTAPSSHAHGEAVKDVTSPTSPQVAQRDAWLQALATPHVRVPSPSASLVRQREVLRSMDALITEGKNQLQPDWLRLGNGLTIRGGNHHSLATLRQSPNRSPLMHLEREGDAIAIAAAEDLAAVIDNRKRRMTREQSRKLLAPLTLSMTTVANTQTTYSPIPVEERQRCDRAFNDHPFYVCLSTSPQQQGQVQEERGAISVMQSSSRPTFVELDDDGPDWSFSPMQHRTPQEKQDDHKRKVAAQLREHQHTQYLRIADRERQRAHSTEPGLGNAHSPSQTTHAARRKRSSNGPTSSTLPPCSLRLGQLSVPRQRQAPPAISAVEEYRQSMANAHHMVQDVQESARHITIPVFMNIRAFA